MVIRVLPSALANQIAAGEVIERPASVLKELMENSLDAKAASIEVHCEDGGSGMLRVRDDGVGIEKSELALALSRHATSKLVGLSDLQRLRSLGFRGEALPSIASVSRLELASRSQRGEQGWSVAVGGSAEVGDPRPVAHPQGTTVTVRDLFFNTPARRRFLRSARTEQRRVEEVFRRLALGRFEAAMSLQSEGRMVLNLPICADAQARTRRVGRVFGRQFLQRSVEIDVSGADLKLAGWVGAQGYDRAQADCQYFYVNGRGVRDPMLRHALRMAFEGLLPSGRHPAYSLYLELDPAVVDVNVHPTKHELRFSEARLVHDFVFRSVQRALRPEAFAVPGIGRADERSGRPAASAGPRDDSEPGGFELIPEEAPPISAEFLPEQVGETSSNYHPSAGVRRASYTPVREPVGAPFGQSSTPSSLGSALVLLHGRVLVARSAETLVLVDYCAARRAAWVRRIQTALSEPERPVVSRPLLLPAVLEVADSIAQLAEDAEQTLTRLGLELRRIGPREVSLRSLPSLFANTDPQRFAAALLDRLAAAGAGACGDVEVVLRAVEGALDDVDAGLGAQPALHELDQHLSDMEAALGPRKLRDDYTQELTGDDLLALIPGHLSRPERPR